MIERGHHRDRVCVVAIVDEEASAGERSLILPPAGERDPVGAPLRPASGSPSATYAASAASAFVALCRARKLNVSSIRSSNASTHELRPIAVGFEDPGARRRRFAAEDDRRGRLA